MENFGIAQVAYIFSAGMFAGALLCRLYDSWYGQKTKSLPAFGTVEKCPACDKPKKGSIMYFTTVKHGKGKLRIKCGWCGYAWYEKPAYFDKGE